MGIVVKEEYIKYLKKYLPQDKLQDGLKKLEMGISPQYIVGNVEFYGHFIEVNPSVLIPRFETELLVDKTIQYVYQKFDNLSDLHILDIGTGSGCIAISLEKELGCIVDACDISLEALEVAKSNARLNSSNVHFFQSDIFSNVSSKYHVVISNPPYIREDEEIEKIVLENEPSLALYAKERGLYFYHHILKDISSFLEDKFIVAFEIGELQAGDIVKYAQKYLKDVDVLVEKDYSNRNRDVFILSK